MYYADNGKDMKQAVAWMEKANATDPKFWNLHSEAKLRLKMKDYAGATKAAEASKKAALAATPLAQRTVRPLRADDVGAETTWRLAAETVRRVINAMVEDVVAEAGRRLGALAPRSADDVRAALRGIMFRWNVTRLCAAIRAA